MEQVVVVGAGPVGLWLAAELRLGGASVTVLELRERRFPHSRGLTIHPRTIEIFDFRGVAQRFVAEGVQIPSGHFGGLPQRLDFSVLDTPFPFTLALPQVRTEQLLEEHARSAGARIVRGHRVTGLRQDSDSVELDVTGPEGPYRLRAAYVVGCDGTRSTVRTSAGIDFPGTNATKWGWLGDVVLDDPPTNRLLSVNGLDGNLILVPLPGGLHRLVGGDPSGDASARPDELTLDELRTSVRRIAGADFGMRDPVWLSRFGNAARQAARYRQRRVLLAGDAAHMHFAAGGVGLNAGVQDATNLGWKLAAVLAGRAEETLLDTYHAERHPVGVDLLLHTRAQNVLMTACSPEGLAPRIVLSQLIATVPALSRILAERLSGLDVAYPSNCHPLAGQRAPNLRFTNGRTLFELLHTGQHVMLDLSGTAATADTNWVWHSAPLAPSHQGWTDAQAVLVRPDGHVAALVTLTLSVAVHDALVSTWSAVPPCGGTVPVLSASVVPGRRFTATGPAGGVLRSAPRPVSDSRPLRASVTSRASAARLRAALWSRPRDMPQVVQV